MEPAVSGDDVVRVGLEEMGSELFRLVEHRLTGHVDGGAGRLE